MPNLAGYKWKSLEFKIIIYYRDNSVNIKWIKLRQGVSIMKKWMLVFFILFVFPVAPVFAHTGLHESMPEQGETVTESISEVVLTFESKIENGSTFELRNSTGEIISPENVSIENSVLKGSIKPLTSGDYKVIWKVIGSDGHPIDGEYSFTVNVPKTQQEQNVTDPQKNTEMETNEDTTLEKEQAAVDKTKTASEETKKDGLSPLTIGVGIIILLAVIMIVWRVSKRSK
jgi:copper resistance protein C